MFRCRWKLCRLMPIVARFIDWPPVTFPSSCKELMEFFSLSTGQTRKILVHSPRWTTHWSDIHRWRERLQSWRFLSKILVLTVTFANYISYLFCLGAHLPTPPPIVINFYLKHLAHFISNFITFIFQTTTAGWDPASSWIPGFTPASTREPREKILDCYHYVNLFYSPLPKMSKNQHNTFVHRKTIFYIKLF